VNPQRDPSPQAPCGDATAFGNGHDADGGIGDATSHGIPSRW